MTPKCFVLGLFFSVQINYVLGLKNPKLLLDSVSTWKDELPLPLQPIVVESHPLHLLPGQLLCLIHLIALEQGLIDWTLPSPPPSSPTPLSQTPHSSRTGID
jgi:hypothetical protein